MLTIIFYCFYNVTLARLAAQVPVKTEHFNSSFGDGATQEEASARVPECHSVTM